MNLAIATNRIASRAPTGVERYARELATAMHARGDVQCEIVAPREPGDVTWTPPGLRAIHVPYPRRLTIAMWCTVHRPPVDRFVTTPDLVHAAAPTFPIPAKVPVVYTVHDVLPLAHPEWFSARNRFGFRLAIRDVQRRAAAIIADSPPTAEGLVELVGIDPTRITVVPLGVSSAFLAGASPADAARAARSVGVEPNGFMLQFGDISARQNVEVLVRALPRLSAPLPLVLAGPESPGLERVRAEAERLHVSELVRFVGYLPDAILVPLVAAARVVVHPSRAEGFGLTPLEAMATGTPAIVASITALPGVVGAAALLVDPDDADAWASTIDSMSDHDRRAEVVQRGRAAAADFTWSHAADGTFEVYRSVLELTEQGG